MPLYAISYENHQLQNPINYITIIGLQKNCCQPHFGLKTITGTLRKFLHTNLKFIHFYDDSSFSVYVRRNVLSFVLTLLCLLACWCSL